MNQMNYNNTLIKDVAKQEGNRPIDEEEVKNSIVDVIAIVILVSGIIEGINSC